ncbi:hypothetical protein QAD02_003733 [Eretmocerus hayati]|uniref:Uncharacterized protein n=1 Tax=Eretmocerus hayati TaxID=131215 RepID=A0ACC2NMH7_9HYME|nr:hypothetical protein QAD02_003733 [Eretmocerus hayati]
MASQPIPQRPTVTKSFAQVAEQFQYPTEDQGSRICFYLRTKALVDKLTDTETNINIGEHVLPVRRLLSKAKRVTISNVRPQIPDSIIMEELAKINIKPVSRIAQIRAGITVPGCSHICSFRSSMHIEPEGIERLPGNMLINHNDTGFWIYFSAEKMTCFLCKEEGHNARHCKNVELLTPANSQVDSDNTGGASSTNQEISTSIESQEEKTVDHTHSDHQFLKPQKPPQSSKRPAPSETSSSSVEKKAESAGIGTGARGHRYATRKKYKTTPESLEKSDLVKQLEPAAAHLKANHEQFSLSFDNLVDFLYETHGKRNALEVASKFTIDTENLNDMLQEVCGMITVRKLKSQIDKIRKCISTGAQMDSDNDFSADDACSQGDNDPSRYDDYMQ